MLTSFTRLVSMYHLNIIKKKKKKPMPQAIGLISSDPAWNNSFCSAFLCLCVWA